jgi:hypothetical protein
MEAVAAHDVIAVDSHRVRTSTKGENRLRAFHIMRRHVLSLVDHRAAEPIPRFIQIARKLGLSVDDHGLATREGVQIHSLPDAVMRDGEAFVNLALAVHSLADLRFAHHFGKAVLQYACADPPEYVIAAMLLEHHGVDAAQVEEL